MLNEPKYCHKAADELERNRHTYENVVGGIVEFYADIVSSESNRVLQLISFSFFAVECGPAAATADDDTSHSVVRASAGTARLCVFDFIGNSIPSLLIVFFGFYRGCQLGLLRAPLFASFIFLFFHLRFYVI